MSTYDLKKRDYVGNTSFDAELSLITANQALVIIPLLDSSMDRPNPECWFTIHFVELGVFYTLAVTLEPSHVV